MYDMGYFMDMLMETPMSDDTNQMVIDVLAWAIRAVPAGNMVVDRLRGFVVGTNRMDDNANGCPCCGYMIGCVANPCPVHADGVCGPLCRPWFGVHVPPVDGDDGDPHMPIPNDAGRRSVFGPGVTMVPVRPVYGPCPNHIHWGDESLSCPNVPYGHDCDCVVGTYRHYRFIV
jgi:hypothetical protein